MNEKIFLEEKEISEQKIAHLCNEFVQCRNMNIKHIDVNYGNCKKGRFPDWIINIDVVTEFILDMPCGGECDDEAIRRILKMGCEE
jgi:hypothetical protein